MSHSPGEGSPHRVLGSFMLIPVLTGVFLTAALASNLLHRRSRDNAAIRYYSADRVATMAAERWVISTERDSLVPWASSLRSRSDSLVVRVDAGVPNAVARVADSLLRVEWKSLGAHRQDARVAAVIMLDTTRSSGTLKRPHERPPRYVMPWALDGRTCVAVFHLTRDLLVDPTLLAKGVMSNGNNPVSLGPCAFVSALGVPGKGARDWLSVVGNSHAVVANWWAPHVQPAKQFTSNAIAVDSSLHGVQQADYEERIAEGLRSPRIAACRAGQDSSCASVIDPLSSTSTNNARYVLVAAERLVPPPGVLLPETHSLQTSVYGALLSDLVRDAGVERAGSAWRGDAPFIRALATAMSITPEAMGSAWVRSNVPPVARTDMTLSAAAVGTPLLLSLLLLALAFTTTRSRERT